MKNGKFPVLGLCYCNIDRDYQSIVLKNMRDEAVDQGCRIISFSPLDAHSYDEPGHLTGEYNIFNLINYAMIDVMIVLKITFASVAVYQQIIKRCKEEHIPVVIYDGKEEHAWNVTFDQSDSMYRMVRHFIEHHGFTEINFFTSMRDEFHGNLRLASYKKALEESGIAYDDTRVFEGRYDRYAAMKETERMLAENKKLPQAIVCANDTMAMGVIKVLEEHDICCPQDVAVSGYDGIREGTTHAPRITTIRPAYADGAKRAVQMALQILHGETVDQDTVCKANLVLTESCGCAVSLKTNSNEINHRLYNEIDDLTYFSKFLIKSDSAITESVGLQSAYEKLRNEIRYAYTKKVWVCITENFFSETGIIDGAVKNGNYYLSGYSPTMKIVAYKSYDICTGLDDFPAEQLLPNFISELEDCGFISFIPLHNNDRTIGYFAFEVSELFERYDFWYSMAMSISGSLSTMKTQNELRSIIARLEDMYVHDPLTGLFNRRGFFQHIEKKLQEYGGSANIMMISIDVDGLKDINDEFGHLEGDNAIKTVAKALSSISIRDEICARFGGDEFIVAGINENEEYSHEFTDRFQEYIQYYNKHSEKPYEVRASVGQTIGAEKEIHNIDELIATADQHMYENKARNKAKFRQLPRCNPLDFEPGGTSRE